MEKLPTTEEELKVLIDSAVKEATDTLTARHNEAMAGVRKKHAEELANIKKEAGLSAEELAKQKMAEEYEALNKEVADLRAYKKTNEISSRLAKEGLPEYLKNDSRLINADDSTFESVLKTVKKDYEATLPKGATRSTVVQTATGQKTTTDSKAEVYEKTGEALKEALGI